MSETKEGITNTFAYNHAGRMRSVTLAGSQRGPYRYNAFGQLASRQLQTVTPPGIDPDIVHMLYDQDGNLLCSG